MLAVEEELAVELVVVGFERADDAAVAAEVFTGELAGEGEAGEGVDWLLQPVMIKAQINRITRGTNTFFIFLL